MIARRWGLAFLVILGGFGVANMASADTLTALGITLGLAFSLEAAAVVATLTAPTIAALGQGMAASIAVGGGIGAVNLAALGLVGGVLGIVGIAVVGGIVVGVLAPGIIASAQGRGPGGAPGQSGEMTNDMAAANEAAAAEATAAANLAAIIASFPPNPLPLPTVRFSVNPATGEVTVTSVDGIDTGQGATPNTTCCTGFTLGQEISLSPAITVTPGLSDLPAIGESIPGEDVSVSDGTISVESSLDAGEYGWVDGICRHYATGVSCAEYREHEYDEYGDHARISWLGTGWLMLLASFGLGTRWLVQRWA